ncbi:MAG: IclR family transcriptional regulator [Burkholderiaceae bacterium]|nr:IclR family transcriptional regulator [Burkholderiaceae bacterium]
MSSLSRMLSVLDLFSREHTTMTADQIAAALGLTRTTCYRYTRELGQAGLLVSDGGLFMLGPRIIELDHRIIESDPLLNAGSPVVSALAESLGATGLLTTCYGDRIINVFQHEGALQRLPMSFGRGTMMPIFRSASSKVIVASMSRGRLKRLWKDHQHEPDCRSIGADWLSFWRNLQAIKRQGYWTSSGELDTGLAGIAAPILFGTGEVAGSMSLVFALKDFKNYDTELLGARLRGAAAQLSQKLAELRRSESIALRNPAATAKGKPRSRRVDAKPGSTKARQPQSAAKSRASSKRPVRV